DRETDRWEGIRPTTNDQRLTITWPQLAETRVAPAAHPIALIQRGVRCVVVLVIRLGDPEGRCGLHARHHAFELLRRLERLLRCLRLPLLRVAAVKDDGAVLRAEVAELAGAFCGIGVVPIRVEQRVVPDLRRIEDDAYRFDVSGDAELDLFVARALRGAAGVADGDRLYAGNLVEDVLHAPEAAA